MRIRSGNPIHAETASLVRSDARLTERSTFLSLNFCFADKIDSEDGSMPIRRLSGKYFSKISRSSPDPQPISSTLRGVVSMFDSAVVDEIPAVQSVSL
jgi:hypothetical protein